MAEPRVTSTTQAAWTVSLGEGVGKWVKATRRVGDDVKTAVVMTSGVDLRDRRLTLEQARELGEALVAAAEWEPDDV